MNFDCCFTVEEIEERAHIIQKYDLSIQAFHDTCSNIPNFINLVHCSDYLKDEIFEDLKESDLIASSQEFELMPIENMNESESIFYGYFQDEFDVLFDEV